MLPISIALWFMVCCFSSKPLNQIVHQLKGILGLLIKINSFEQIRVPIHLRGLRRCKGRGSQEMLDISLLSLQFSSEIFLCFPVPGVPFSSLAKGDVLLSIATAGWS